MNAASSVLFAVASELSAFAKSKLPEIKDREKVEREWLDDGIYFRELSFDGKTIRDQYDFRQRKSRRAILK